jgi:hypothetical protein
MPRKSNSPTLEPQPELMVTHADAEQRLTERIRLGEALQSDIQTPESLNTVRGDLDRWHAFNGELLERLFTSDKFAKEYRMWGLSVISMNASFRVEVQEFLEELSHKINRLFSIRDRLPLIPTRPGVPQVTRADRTSGTGRVFIVHGHDSAARDSLARFIARLELVPVILHEQAGRSRTIIEKLEDYSDVEFALVLLTSDDVGTAKKDQGSVRPRARQNVILELGYFVGKLGRDRVCALYENGVELPSDVLGVQFVELRSGWEMEVGKELRAAGFVIDMNKLC